VIRAWLDSCDLAVVLLTPAALASPWVRHELGVLLHRFWQAERGLQGLVPVLLDGVTRTDLRSDWAEPAQLAEVHTDLVFDATVSDDDVSNSVVAAVKRVLEDALFPSTPSSLRHRARYHAKPLLPAGKKKRDLLDRAAKDLFDGDPSIDPVYRRPPVEFAALREWVALELCRTRDPWVGIEPLLRHVDSDAYDLTDMNLCAFFDPRTCGPLIPRTGAAQIVLACVDEVAAELAVRAAVTSSRAAEWASIKVVHYAVLPEAAGVAEDVVRGVREALRRAYRRGVDIDEVLRVGANRAVRDSIYAIIRVPDETLLLLDPDVPTRASQVLGGAVKLIFIGESPNLLAAQLGLTFLGPGDDLLTDYLSETSDLVTEREVLHSRIHLELTYGKRTGRTRS
jgi:hypothetical protein